MWYYMTIIQTFIKNFRIEMWKKTAHSFLLFIKIHIFINWEKCSELRTKCVQSFREVLK